MKLRDLDITNLLHEPNRAVKIHTWLFWGSFAITPVAMFFVRDAVWVVQFISWYTVWFQHIDGKQAALAQLEAANTKG